MPDYKWELFLATVDSWCLANDFFGMRMWTCPIAIRNIQEEDYTLVTSILGYILHYTGLLVCNFTC